MENGVKQSTHRDNGGPVYPSSSLTEEIRVNIDNFQPILIVRTIPKYLRYRFLSNNLRSRHPKKKKFIAVFARTQIPFIGVVLLFCNRDFFNFVIIDSKNTMTEPKGLLRLQHTLLCLYLHNIQALLV